MSTLEIPGYRQVEPLFQNERTLAFRAVRLSDDRSVVLKSVAPGTSDHRARWRLQHEQQILDELPMAGVVAAHGIELTPLGPTLVLDYVGGSTLELSPGEVLSLDHFLDIGARLARVVAEIHAAGVCHRDINPRNIAFDRSSADVFLIDFGLATRLTRQSTDVTPLGQLEGTLGYLSPEQTGRMNRSVDRRTDLYSMGVTLYELLVGRRPFESADHLEILYATVARMPRPPQEVRADVPPVLSAIIQRLLAKDPEDRYQNAQALADDLERCRTLLDDAGQIETFEIGLTDRRGTLQVPERLYGRRRAISTLEAALRRACESSTVFVGITGPPGSGKTALSRELLPRLSGGGLLVSGVCDALDRTPYGPILQALRAVLTSVVEGVAEQRPMQRARFDRVIGSDGGLLLRLLPDAVEIIGEQEVPVELGPSEARERMLDMLVRLLRAYHQPSTPLVLFLDDLQWADPGSLDVLERLLDSDELGGPLVLMAWRDGEVGPAHPLTRLLSDRVEMVALGPLTAEDTAQLVADAMGLPPAQVGALAAAVRDKSGGNAFFLRELLGSLVRDGLICFDSAQLQWTWSLDGIAALPPTHNVVELLSRQLRALSPQLQRVLGVAAVIGKRFELGVLADVAQMSIVELSQVLVVGLQAGLIVGSGRDVSMMEAVAQGGDDTGIDLTAALGFVHDEVYESALALVPEAERAPLHLAAGRNLMGRWRTERASLFPAADHFERALDLLADESERRAVTQLLLAAARNASASAAFQAALHYAEVGIGLLTLQDWEVDHDVAFQLHLLAAQAHLMCPDHVASVDFTTVAMEQASGVLERIAVQRARISAHTARYELDETLKLTLEALGWVGVKLPRGANLGHVAMALMRTTLKVRGKSLDDLRALPPNTDPQVAAAMQLLTDAAAVTYYTDALLLPVLLCRLVDLSIDHGVAGPTAFGSAGWAFLRIVTRDDVEGAKDWSVFAGELVDRFDARHIAPKVELLVLGFVEARCKPLASLADPFQRVSWAAKAVGDAEYACLGAMNRSNFAFLGGVGLAEVNDNGLIDLALCKRYSREQSTNNMLMTLQAVECLRGLTVDPATLSGTHFDADELAARLTEGGDKSGVALLRMLDSQVKLLLGETGALIDAVQAATGLVSDLPGSPHVPPFLMHAALAWIRHMREQGEVGGKPLRAARKHQKKLAAMAEKGPLSFAHKARLVEAELAGLSGDIAGAQLIYEDAVRLARASGIVHEEALVLDCAARAAERFGNDRLASSLAQDAQAAWLSWGSAPLAERLADLVVVAHRSSTSGTLMTQARSVNHTLSGEFDVASVVKAAQVLSSEIQLTELLRKLMCLIVENAGATWGMLVLKTDGKLKVAATAALAETGGIEASVNERHARTDVVAERGHAGPMVHDVARTRRVTVVHDGVQDDRYFGEAEGAPKSALCLPVRKGRDLVGVMYLENAVARNAFTVERSEIVGVLCSQAAVSIENATLYTDLQDALDRQRQITTSFERFVPKQFLNQLGRSSILDVQLGDQVEREMAILFMDIRNFTTLSEQLGARETFELVNMLLARLGPTIRHHGGFIDKYIGDAIMALFPGSADDAVRAAVDIQRAVAAVRATAALGPRRNLRVGVGVHRGVTMLGTIGEAERMDSTVISDAVNVASRIEGLTKAYGVDILISDATTQQLDEPDAFSRRYLGRADVKGKAATLGVHEILDPERNSGDVIKLETSDEIALGVEQLDQQNWDAARGHFVTVLARNPDDGAARALLERALSGGR